MDDQQDYGVSLPPATPTVDYGHMIKTLAAIRGILNARLLVLLSLIGAVIIFAFGTYDPSTLRLWAASLYSVGVLWPLIVLYIRKG